MGIVCVTLFIILTSQEFINIIKIVKNIFNVKVMFYSLTLTLFIKGIYINIKGNKYLKNRMEKI